MHRSFTRSIVRLFAVVQLFIFAGVAQAETKIACVGDSITALPSSWCGDLQTKLGADYTVTNFGVSGTNLAKGVSQPYWDSVEYTPSHTFAPDIVIIMLGTNDAFSFSWSSAKSHFVADYEELLDTYTSLASKPKPYIIIPTPIGTSPFGHDGNLLATEVVPLVKQVAMEKMVPTIDAFTLFGGAMFDASLYGGSDQVHPNAEGQQKICDKVYEVLMSSGGLGGTGGAGGSAGSAGSASAGSGGMAGGSAGSGGSGNAGGGGMAGGVANAGTGGAGGSVNAGSGGMAGGGVSAGSSANTAGSASMAGAGGSANAGSGPISVVNPIGAAGTSAPPVAAHGSAGGCRMARSSTSQGGPATALLLLLAIAIRRRKRSVRRLGRGLLLIVLCAACGAESGSSNPTAPTGPVAGTSSTSAPIGQGGAGVAPTGSPGAGGSTATMTPGAPLAGTTGAMPAAGGPGAMATGGTTGAGTAGATAAAGSGGAAGTQSAGTGGQGGAPANPGPCTASTAASTTATGTGPHKVVVETNSDSGIAEGTIYRPMDLGGAEKYPIFAWGEGGCLQDGLSNAALMGEIASHGYFVIADGKPNGTSSGTLGGDTVAMGKPLLAYITWAIAENDKPCSAYYQSLDTTKTATNGFSCGGLMAEGTAGDPRITTWGLNSSGLFAADQALYKTVHTPVLIVLGGPDDIAYENGENDYTAISALGMPIMLFSKNGSNHGGDLFNGTGDFGKIDLAWLNWWLKGDEGATGKGVLVGSGCTYCTDSTWEVKSMNVP